MRGRAPALTLLVVNPLLGAVVAAFLVRSVAPHVPPLADFPAFYTGWTLALRAEADLYDAATQGAVQRALLGASPYAGGVLPFLHPPHAAVLLAPLALLPMRAAWALWMAALGALTAALVARGQALLPPRPPPGRLLATSVLVGFPALALALVQAQPTPLLVVAFLAIPPALERRGSDAALAGALLALSLKPQLLPLPLALVLAHRRTRALGLFAGLLAAAVAGSAWRLGPATWQAWAAAAGGVLDALGERGFVPESMNNLRGVLMALFGRLPALNTVATLAPVLAAVALIGAARHARAAWPAPVATPLLAAWAAWGCAFFSPHLYAHDELFLPIAALLVDRALAAAAVPAPRLRVFLLLMPALAVLGETLWWHRITLGGARPSVLVTLALTGALARATAAIRAAAARPRDDRGRTAS